jgi:amino acid transporter
MSMVRGIGVGSASALVAANMIGAGVFTTSGFALADLGSPIPVLVAWVVGGVLALCGALSYAGLAKQIPGNGGEYLFLSRTVHPLVGFLAGWVSLLAGFTAPIAVAAHGLEAYTRGSFGFDLPDGVLGAGAIILAGLTHGIARAPGLRLQDIAVAVKLLAIIAFIVVGAVVLGRGESVASVPVSLGDVSIPAFAVTLVWISFAYSGWNAAVYVAGELDDPGRTLIGPRVYAQMAEDGVLPRSLAAGRDAPHRAIALQVGLSLVAFFMSELRELLLYVGFLLGLSAAATVSCLFMKSMREGDEGAGVPGFPWVPGIFIVATLGSAVFMVLRQPAQAAAGIGTLVLGAIVYFVGVRRRQATA